MSRALWPTDFASFRPAAAGSSSGSWPPLAASGCGHEAKIDFKTVSKPPTVQVINPPIRNIVRTVGQPSFIESLRAHVDLSQADRLYREVERRHRRQGQEGADARHPVRARAGRGLRDEEGDRRAR